MSSVDIVIASALVLMLLVFIRISWTLKDIHAALVVHSESETKVKVDFAPYNAENNIVVEEAPIDETEIAAVIAVASAAMRAAV